MIGDAWRRPAHSPATPADQQYPHIPPIPAAPADQQYPHLPKPPLYPSTTSRPAISPPPGPHPTPLRPNMFTFLAPNVFNPTPCLGRVWAVSGPCLGRVWAVSVEISGAPEISTDTAQTRPRHGPDTAQTRPRHGVGLNTFGAKNVNMLGLRGVGWGPGGGDIAGLLVVLGYRGGFGRWGYCWSAGAAGIGGMWGYCWSAGVAGECAGRRHASPITSHSYPKHSKFSITKYSTFRLTHLSKCVGLVKLSI